MLQALLRRVLVVLGGLGLAWSLISCGKTDERPTNTLASPATTTTSPRPNACPADGCRVRIASVVKGGDELKLTMDANYTPDVSRNHFHVFWDTYTARQVSNDAEPRFGVTQGDWVPTADNPYTTAEAVSVAARKGATKVCVTAGDRDHNVIDPEIIDCRDVSGLF